MSIPRIQKIGAKTFKSGVERNLKLQGFTVDILHDPTQYNETKASKDAEGIKAQKEERAAKQSESQQRAIDAAVAKALEGKDAETQKLIDAAVAKALASIQPKEEKKPETGASNKNTDGAKK